MIYFYSVPCACRGRLMSYGRMAFGDSWHKNKFIWEETEAVDRYIPYQIKILYRSLERREAICWNFNSSYKAPIDRQMRCIPIPTPTYSSNVLYALLDYTAALELFNSLPISKCVSATGANILREFVWVRPSRYLILPSIYVSHSGQPPLVPIFGILKFILK